MTRAGSGGASALRALAALALVALVAPVGCGGKRTERTPVSACALADCEARCAKQELAACARAADLYFHGENGNPLDHARSLRLAAQACDGGVAHGCMLAAFHHQDALGTDWDPARAVTLYEQACRDGSGTACYNLAGMYLGGHGVVVDEPRAATYHAQAREAWARACKGDEPRWCTNLAYAIATGGTPEADTVSERLALDKRACDAGVLAGCVEVVNVRREQGLDPATYVAELDRLCQAGAPGACALAGAVLMIGEKVPADPTRGLALIARGCELGDAGACMGLGLEHGRGELVPRDDAAALRFLGRACDRAKADACAAIADVLAARGDAAGALAFARRACWMNDRRSCAVVGMAYHQGRGVAADEVEAVAWMHLACRSGDQLGCGVLVQANHELPLPPDFRAEMYRRLCAEGVQAACGR